MKYSAILPDEHMKRICLRELIVIIMCSLPIMFILIPNMYCVSNDVSRYRFTHFRVFRHLLPDLKVIMAKSEY